MPAPATISKSISGFDPRSVPECRLWLDAADISSTTGTSPVTAWRDKSIYGNNTTSYGGTPSISASAINGRRSLYFNGSSYFLGAISGANTTTITVFIVGSLISPFGGFSGLVCFGNPSQFDYDNVGSLPITMYNDQFKIYGARNSSSQPTTINANVPFLYVLQYDGTYINTWKNGTIQTDPSTNVASSGTFTYTNYSIACRAGTISGQYPWSGYIGEILVYQSVLTPTQRQSVEGYLAWKWGIQNSSQSFTPTSISGCLLWLDGADTSTASMTQSSGTVSVWKDKSGNGYNFTQLYASLPTITSISRQTGLYFAANQALRNTTLPFPTTYTIFAVANQTGAPSGYAYILHSPHNADCIIFFGTFNGTRYFATFAGPAGSWNDVAANTPNTNVATTSSTASVLCCTNNGTTLTPYINGIVMNTKTGTNAAATGMVIGDTFVSGQPWLGTIGEIIVYNSILSTAQRQQVETYLSRKWGVSVPTNALPLLQPFSSINPFSRIFNLVDSTATPEYWFDAADTSTISTSGSFLTTWLNKGSLTGSNATPSTANTSTSGTTRVNGNNLINIPITQRLQFTGTFPNLARARFIVTRQTSAGDVTYMFQGGAATTGYDYLGISANTLVEIAQGQIVNLQTATISAQTNLMILLTFINSSVATGSNRVALNGSNVTLSTSVIANQYFAGSITTFLSHTGGPGQDLGEFISFNQNLTSLQIFQIEGYLAWKWGLQSSLPATHPYKQFPPSSALPFSPTTISNCQLWMDAAQDTSANNATITTIPDRSANGSNLTAIGTITFNQNFRNGNPVYNFGGSRASNANFNWGTSFTHFVVSSSVNGSWLNSVGSLNTYVGLGNWALVNINSAINFVDPGSITAWSTSGSVTTGVSASGLPFVTLPVSTTSGSATTIYTTPINSVRQTSFSLVLPSTAGLYSYFGLANGTTTLQFLLNTSGGVPSQIYFFFGGNPTLNVVAGSTVFCSITNTSLYMIVYPSGSNVTVSWTNSGAGEYYMYFNVIGNGANANTTTYANIQFDPAQGGSILPKTTGLVNAWNITSIGYTSGSTTLTNYAVNGNPRSSTTSTPHSGQTPVLPLYINGSSGGAYDTSYFAEIIHYNVALPTAQRQQVEGYLAAKWGISLPSTHPYYKFQPSQLTNSSIIASGGTITVSGSTIYNTFTSSGNFVVNGTGQVNYLIVGGGGGGGDRHGGGGGAGGVVSGTFTAVTGTYAVTVGNGGAGGNYEANNSSPQGSGVIGGLSTVSGVNTGYGGGGGGTYDGNPTGTVGSGGGGGGNGYAGVAGTAGQGNAGGSGLQPGAGGGGGAGGAGVNANTGTGGIGTAAYSTQLLAVGYGTTFAVASSPNTVISGGVAYIAGGGGGAAGGSPGPGGTGGLGGGGRGDWDNSYISAGTANTGGGGGGSRSESGGGSAGFAGGSGLVIFWYGI